MIVFHPSPAAMAKKTSRKAKRQEITPESLGYESWDEYERITFEEMASGPPKGSKPVSSVKETDEWVNPRIELMAMYTSKGWRR